MRKAMMLLAGAMAAAMLFGGCAAGVQTGEETGGAGSEGAATEQPQQTASEILRDKGEALITLMVEKAESEQYRSMMSSDEAVGKVLDQIEYADYETPESVYQIKMTEEIFQMIYGYAGVEDISEMSENLRQDLEGRLMSAVASMLNARAGGASVLAAASVINSGSSFLCPGMEEGIIYLYFYENGFPALVLFYPQEDDVVTGSASFLMVSDWKGISGEDFQDMFQDSAFDFVLPANCMEKVGE